MRRIFSRILFTCSRLRRDNSGLALLEFAFSLPILLTLSLSGAELTNYIITKMRVSQIALHIADNAARIGSGSQLEAKKITEADINDLLVGADLQSGELKLLDNGRVIISSLEPVASPNPNDKYVIRWQRCKGAKTAFISHYGSAGPAEITGGIGPAGRKVTAADYGVTMFVEVQYEYKPLINLSLAESNTITEIASMMVRDRRDTTDDSNLGANAKHPNGVYKVAGVIPSTCT